MKVVEPPAALAPFVDRFWYRGGGQPGEPGAPLRVLPDGCLDIVVGPRQAIVVGAMTRPILVSPADGTGLLGVRFRPGMATAFLRVPAADLTDGQAPLEAVWADGAQVADYVGSALGTEQAIARLEETLTARLARVGPVPVDVRTAVEWICRQGGRIDVARVAGSLGVTRQHLARRFATHVGVTPKTFCRVVRLWRLLRRTAGGRVNWAGLAAELGYSDQPHLVAEFRRLTGVTPGRWLAERGAGSKSASRGRGRAVS